MIGQFLGIFICIFFLNQVFARDINDSQSSETKTYIKVVLVNENRQPAAVGDQAAGVKFEYYEEGKLQRFLGGRVFNFCEIEKQSKELSKIGLITWRQVGVGVGGGLLTVVLGALGGFGTAGGAGAGVPVLYAAGATATGTVATIGYLQVKKSTQKVEASTLSEDAVGGKDVQTNLSIPEYADKMDSALGKIKAPTNWISDCKKRIPVSADRISPHTETPPKSPNAK